MTAEIGLKKKVPFVLLVNSHGLLCSMSMWNPGSGFVYFVIICLTLHNSNDSISKLWLCVVLTESAYLFIIFFFFGLVVFQL